MFNKLFESESLYKNNYLQRKFVSKLSFKQTAGFALC